MSGKYVLVCSTERHIVRLVRVNLERQGYEVQVACSGEDALANLPVDVLVVDAHLGDMTGQELKRRVRENPDTANIRVILLRDPEN